MKKAGAAFLLFAMVLHLCSKTTVSIQFSILQDYIETVLCVERSDLNNSCKGACHLRKGMMTDQTNGDSSSRETAPQIEITYFFSDVTGFCLNDAGSSIPELACFELSVVNGYQGRIFQPPRFRA